MLEKVIYFKFFYYVYWIIEKFFLKFLFYCEVNVVRKCLYFRIISFYWFKFLYFGWGFLLIDLIYVKIF